MQISHISTISMLSFSMYTLALPAPRPEEPTGSGADVLGLQTQLSTDKVLAAVTEPNGLDSNKLTEKKEEGNTPLAVGPNELSKKKDPLTAGLSSVKTPAVPGEIPEQCRQYVTGAEKGGAGHDAGGAGKGGHDAGGADKGGHDAGGAGKGGHDAGGAGKGGHEAGGAGKGGHEAGGAGKGGAEKGGAEKGGAGKTEPPKITPPVHEAPKKSPKEPPTKTSSAVSSQIQGTQAIFTTAFSSSVLVYAIAAVFL